MNKTYHLLVVDDDARLRQLLARYLGENGFQITAVADAAEARDMLKTLVFDLIILDVMMPGESGLDFAEALHRESFTTPILFLTAMGDVEDRIKGLERGADDYLPKPFEPRELLLRIRAILKRQESQPPQTHDAIEMGPFTFMRGKGKLYQGEVEVSLTTSESNLLNVFIARHGDVLSREFLAEKMGNNTSVRSVDVQVTRLRRKLEEDPKLPKFLQTVRNKGYVLWLS